MEIKEWLGTQLGVDIWTNKYQYNNETFEEWLDRVSAGDEEVKELIRDKKFLFGGRILSNRGLNKLGKKVTNNITIRNKTHIVIILFILYHQNIYYIHYHLN